MSIVSSFVERTQLQHFTRFRTAIPFLAAVVVFSGLPIVGRAPSASVSALATTLTKALTRPHSSGDNCKITLLTSLFDFVTHAINTACLRVRIHIKLPFQWPNHVFNRSQNNRDDASSLYTYYATSRAEAKYWRVADRYRRRLYSGSGTGTAFITVPSIQTPTPPTASASRDRDRDQYQHRYQDVGAGADSVIPLVTYYTPRLLPLYRDRDHHHDCSPPGGPRVSRTDVDAREGRIPPRTFCKWHRMVFPDLSHPTLAQAAAQMKHYSNRDLREIQRIARMLPDEHVFQANENKPRKAKKRWNKYGEMWRDWLENKGADLVIVFE